MTKEKKDELYLIRDLLQELFEREEETYYMKEIDKAIATIEELIKE